MDKAAVNRWLGAYVVAWKSYDSSQIGELFAEDVQYRYHPYDEPVVGRDAVVRSWRGDDQTAGTSTRDQEGTYDASYQAVAIDGDVAVAIGSSRYTSRPGGAARGVYDHCFVMRFNSAGQCCELTEWYVKRPTA